MKFDIISIIFIVIFVISVLIGIKKGFFKTVSSLVKGILSFVLTIFLSKPLAKVLLGSTIGINLEEKLLNFLNNKGEFFQISINNSNKVEVISKALEDLNMPQFLTDIIASFIPITAENTVAEALAPTISYYVLLAISFIVLFIIFRLLSMLLDKLFAIMEQIPFVGTLNKLCGGVLNGFLGVLLICIISYGFTFIVPLDNGFSSFIIEQMELYDNQVVTLSKYFYENNFLLKIIALINF